MPKWLVLFALNLTPQAKTMEMATKFHLIKKDIDDNLYINDKYSRIMLNSCDICGLVVTCCDDVGSACGGPHIRSQCSNASSDVQR